MGEVQTTLRLNDQASSVLKKVAQSAQQAAKTMEQAGKSIDQAFTTNTPAQFASKAGTAFQNIESEAETLGRTINEAFETRGADNFGSRMENGFRTAESGANSFKSTANQTGKAVDNLGDKAQELGESVEEAGAGAEGVGKIGDEARGAGSGLSEANGQAVNLISTIKKIAVTVGALSLANKLKNFVTDSINIGRDYSAQMSEVAAISGATGDDYKMLEETAREYGATTVFSATEAAEALKYMSLAGWDAQQSSSALGGVLNLAAASGMELGQASDMVTDYLSAFGMEANQSAYFADMLAYAQSNSNTTAAQLGEAYLNSAANLHSAGQDVETTTSLLEAMANQGTKGSRAGTQLAAIARDITNNMEDGKIMIGDTSVAVKDASGNFRDFTDILTDVEKATDGMGSAEKAAALATTFTADSTKGINQVLIEGMDKISGYEEALRNSGGSAEKAAETMNDNLKGDQANLTSAFEEMQLQIFEGLDGTLRSGTQYLTNSVIPILTDWVPKAASKAAEGISKIANVLKPVFEGILKNPGAVAGVFGSMAAGITAFQGINRISQLAELAKGAQGLTGLQNVAKNAGGLSGGLAKIGEALASHPWAALGAAAAAGITATVIAVKKWNQAQIKESFSERFGDIELSKEQAEQTAEKILNMKWKVNVEASLEHFTNAEELAQQASEALSQNEAIEWKARLGFELDDSETSSYTQNIQSYIDNVKQALSEQTLAASQTFEEIGTTFGGGVKFSDMIQRWASQDIADASALSSKLTETVEAALKDGIIDVNEQEAIDLLQQKLNNLMSNWDMGEAQAKMDMIEQKYGRLSGKDLTKDSFTEVVERLGEQREEAAKELEERNEYAYGIINSQLNAGRLTEGRADQAKSDVAKWARNQEAESLVNSLQYETNTVADTYGDQLDKNRQAMEQKTGKFFQNANNYLKNQDYGSLMQTLESGFTQVTGGVRGKDAKALGELWETMKPDASSLTKLLDEYRDTGQEVPKAVWDGYNEAMQVGAAAGDEGAAWAVLAKQMVDSGQNELIKAIEDGTVGAPPELKDALERMQLNVADQEITIDDIMADIEVGDVTIDQDKLQSLLDGKFESLSQGTAEEVDGGTIAVNFEVEAAMTTEDLAEKLGMDVDQIIKNNSGIAKDTQLEVGTKIHISESGVEIDTSGVTQAAQAAEEQVKAAAGEGETTEVNQKTVVNETLEDGTITDNTTSGQAAEDAAAESTGEAINKTTKVDQTLESGSVDSSQLESAVNSSLNGSQAANITMPANVTLTAGTIDASGIGQAVQDAANSQFASAISVNGTVNANLTKGSDNAAAVYSQVGSAVRSAFSQAYSASARVNVRITANYSLANPSKTISFSGGGTGSATIHASLHAEGGYFDQPHLGMVAEAGPEYIIPMDGSDASRSMLADAEAMMGVSDSPTVTPARAFGSEAESVSEVTGGNSKDINLNINGNGSMKINSNMSKDDVVNILLENVKDILMNIVQQEIMDEGDGAYEY